MCCLSRMYSVNIHLKLCTEPTLKSQGKKILHCISPHRKAVTALPYSSKISRVDSTERICYQGWCYALTLRIIISISALPNIPKWAWRRTKPASSLEAKVTGGWWCTCHWGANDPLPSQLQVQRIESTQRYGYQLNSLDICSFLLLDSYSWLACYSSEPQNCMGTPVAYNELSVDKIEKEVLEAKEGSWIMQSFIASAGTPVWARSPKSQCLFWIIALLLHTRFEYHLLCIIRLMCLLFILISE